MPGIAAYALAGLTQGVGQGLAAEAKQWQDEKKAEIERQTTDRRRAEDVANQEARDRRLNEFQAARDEIQNTNANDRVRLQDELAGKREEQKYARESADKGTYATGPDDSTYRIHGDAASVVKDKETGEPVRGLNRYKPGEGGLNANQRRNALNDGIKAGAPDITKGQSGQDWEKTFQYWRYNGLDPNNSELKSMVVSDLKQQAKDQKLTGPDAEKFVSDRLRELYRDPQGQQGQGAMSGQSMVSKGEQAPIRDPNAPLKKRDRDGVISERSADPPPVAGAKRAADGFWYVADPDRPGKWLKVN